MCLVCDFEEEVVEPDGTDEIGPLCSRGHAPTGRLELREYIHRKANPHAAAPGRLGGLKGAPRAPRV